MPVAIACPKCQTRYAIPEQNLGKPVRCKSCGAVFKTKAPAKQPQPAGQAAAKSKVPQQASKSELAEFGIDGPIGKQADIFAGASAPPQHGGNPLGNFQLEDPGFADVSQVQYEVEQESTSGPEGMDAILNNPYLTPASGSDKKKKRSKRQDIDVSGYTVARVGMWIVYVCWGIMLGIGVLFSVLGTIGRFLPEETLKSIAQTLGPTVGSIIGWVLLTLIWVGFLCAGLAFIGQILCIFAPNKDERLFAGLSVGSIVAAFGLLIGIFFMGVLGSIMGGGDSDGGQVAMAAIGIMVLLALFAIYVLALASMFFFMTFFKRVGKNIRSKKVVESAKAAMGTWIAAIAMAFITVAAMMIIGFVAGSSGEGPSETIAMVADILGIINLFLSISVMATLVIMVKAAIDGTQARA